MRKRKLELLEAEIRRIHHVPEVPIQRPVHPPTDDAVRAARRGRVLEVLLDEIPLSRHDRRGRYVGMPNSPVPLAVTVGRPPHHHADVIRGHAGDLHGVDVAPALRPHEGNLRALVASVPGIAPFDPVRHEYLVPKIGIREIDPLITGTIVSRHRRREYDAQHARGGLWGSGTSLNIRPPRVRAVIPTVAREAVPGLLIDQDHTRWLIARPRAAAGHSDCARPTLPFAGGGDRRRSSQHTR